MKLFKDYQLIGGNILFKPNIDEHRHLLHSRGSVPAIDAYVWDEYYTRLKKIKKIRIHTNKARVWKIDGGDFDRQKEEIDLGFGRQYIVPKEAWNITEHRIT